MMRRGSILLEVLLATAVFAFAGVVVLGAVDGSVTDGARAARRDDPSIVEKQMGPARLRSARAPGAASRPSERRAVQ